jgi:hypothetical protein
MGTVHLLDYVAGNVRSLANAIEKLGFNIEWIKEPKDIAHAEVGPDTQLGSFLFGLYENGYFGKVLLIVDPRN